MGVSRRAALMLAFEGLEGVRWTALRVRPFRRAPGLLACGFFHVLRRGREECLAMRCRDDFCGACRGDACPECPSLEAKA